MKKNNKLYRILALFLVMALALFLTPTAFAADDLDDLGPLIPSDLDPDHPDNLPPLIPSDFDDLPPLIPKVPPGKEPPTRPPIEIEVPDDEDLDLNLSESEIKKIIEGSAWTISINDTWSGRLVSNPDHQVTIILSFVADKPGGADMFGTYKARAAIINHLDNIEDTSVPTQSDLDESDNFTIELTPHKAEPVDEDDDLGPLLSPVAESIGEMPLTTTVLADPFGVLSMNPTNYIRDIKIYVSENGSVRMFFPWDRDLFVNGAPIFLGTLSRSIDGRELT